MRLGRLADADIAAYVVDRFEETNRSVGECVGPLVATAAGHPQRAMLLAYRLWDEIPAGETGTQPAGTRRSTRRSLELEPEFEARWQRFSAVEHKSLRAVVEGRRRAPADERARAARRGQDLREPRAPPAREPGRGRRRRRRGPRCVDPLFSLWIDRVASGAFAGGQE